MLRAFNLANRPNFIILRVLAQTFPPASRYYGAKRRGGWWARCGVVMRDNRSASDKLFLDAEDYCGMWVDNQMIAIYPEVPVAPPVAPSSFKVLL